MLVEFQWNDPKLIAIWKDLYKENLHLFPYSSREYNEEVFRYKKIKPSTMFQKEYFYVYYDDQQPMKALIIFPLYKKKNSLFIFGDNISGAGNLDFVYDKNITDEQLLEAFKELANKFKGKSLKLYKVNEISRLYDFFHEYQDELCEYYHLKAEMDRVCVKVIFSNDYEEYFKNLSNNAKSNLRKAYNKCEKANVDIKLEIVQGVLKDKQLLSDLLKIYTKRESERKKRKHHYLPFLKHRYFSALAWAMQALDSHYTFCLFLNGSPVAFMTGFATNFNEIVFPIVAIDSAYSQYAPGKLMISESIKYLQAHTEIRALDLSRGDERYKLEMGGTKHYNYQYILEF